MRLFGSTYSRLYLHAVACKTEILLLLAISMLWLFGIPVSAQYLQNGAMESESTGSNNPPDFWGVCDIYSTPELQDVFIRDPDTIYSPDYSNFSILRLRGEDNNPAGTGEHLFTRLITPLEKGYCFEFSAWLFHTYNGSYNITTYPVRLQLWGGLDSCSMDEMLYESDLIVSSCCWEEYQFYFSVENNNYPYLYIRPYWDFENVSEEYYDGLIMMDNLAIEKIKPSEPLLVDTVYYSIDPPLQLRAGAGIAYSWTPPEVVSDPEDRDPILLEYVDRLDVIIQDLDNCQVHEQYIVLYNCDDLYKDGILNEYDVYFSLLQDVELTASEGTAYNWEPQTNLSGYDIRNPILTGYQESFIVEVEDQLGCLFYEQFNILDNCDTLYPQKSFYTLDTIIYQGQKIVLQPSFGSPVDQWSPVVGLSCGECVSPEASPTSSTTYQVELSDQFNCIHEELFSIEVIFDVPNVITPNGDGYNDEFEIRGLPRGSSIYIYRKDGSLVYANTSYGYPEWWSGTDNRGNAIAAGSYWYMLEIPAMGIVRKDFIFVKR